MKLQLTDAMQKMIKNKSKCGMAIKFLGSNECIDIGTPENYYSCNMSFHIKIVLDKKIRIR